MIIRTACEHCGEIFEAATFKARYCGDTHRKAASRARKKAELAAAAEPADTVEDVPADSPSEDEGFPLHAATLAELQAVNRATSALGLAALYLAQQIDMLGNEPGALPGSWWPSTRRRWLERSATWPVRARSRAAWPTSSGVLVVSWLSEEDVAERYPGIVLPAHFAVPDIEHTRGPTVGKVAALAGIPPDPQQQLALDIVFAVKSPADQLALVATLCIVVGRQVMKSTLFEMVLLGWLFVTGEVDVTYSAHEDKTAASIWRRLSKRIKDTPQLAELLPMTENRGCYSANGQRRIELADGRQIEFVTRTEDGSRGLGKAKVIIDEAYAATMAMLEAILPLILAQADPQVLFASMAGKAASEALRSLRDEGRGRTDPDGAYLEWCAPPAKVICDDGDQCSHRWGIAVGCGFDKPEWRRVAMPSYLHRLTQRAVDILRKRLSPKGFGRECFGWWDEPTEKGEPPAFKVDRWRDITDPDPDHVPAKLTRYGVDCDLGGSVYSFGAAGRRDDDRMHLEFVRTGRGEDWAIAEGKRIDEEHGPATFAIDGGGPAKHLIEPFTEAGLSVEVLNLDDHIAAARALLEGVNTTDSIEYVHGPQPELDDAVEAARLRRIGERGNGLGRRKSAGDITPITSVMFAAWLVDDLDYDLGDSFG